MNSLKSIAGIMLLLAILTLTIAAAQEKPKKQTETLDAVPFDRVVLLTLQALENNWKVKEKLLPNVHVDDYYFFILRTAKRLALQKTRKDTSKTQTSAKKEVKKPEEK